MPKNSKTYNKEHYTQYWGTPKRKKYRAGLNKANRDAGTYGNGDNLDMAHLDNNPKNMSKKNLKKVPMAVNRKAGAKKATAVKRKKKSSGPNLHYV